MFFVPTSNRPAFRSCCSCRVLLRPSATVQSARHEVFLELRAIRAVQQMTQFRAMASSPFAGGSDRAERQAAGWEQAFRGNGGVCEH